MTTQDHLPEGYRCLQGLTPDPEETEGGTASTRAEMNIGVQPSMTKLRVCEVRPGTKVTVSVKLDTDPGGPVWAIEYRRCPKFVTFWVPRVYMKHGFSVVATHADYMPLRKEFDPCDLAGVEVTLRQVKDKVSV